MQGTALPSRADDRCGGEDPSGLVLLRRLAIEGSVSDKQLWSRVSNILPGRRLRGKHGTVVRSVIRIQEVSVVLCHAKCLYSLHILIKRNICISPFTGVDWRDQRKKKYL